MPPPPKDTARRTATRSKSESSPSDSLTGSSFAACLLLDGLDRGSGAVVVHEHGVGHAADVGLAHLVDALDAAKHLAPVAVALLRGGKGDRQTLIAVEAAQQVDLGARLHHL